MKSRIYPNGFIFTEENVEVNKLPDYYETEKIFSNYYYYYDKYSEKIVHHKNNNFIIIHGLFAHIDSVEGDITQKSPDILLDLFSNNKNLFLDTLDYLAGRFVIIIGNEISFEVYTDAAGMRSVYYYLEGKSLLGSHINLLKDILPVTSDSIYNLNNNSIKIWDNTQFSEFKSLNPNFRYLSKDNSTWRIFPRENNKYKNMTHEEKIKLFTFLWQEQLKCFTKKYNSVIFSITGGADSRVSLSLAKNYLNEMNFFTYVPTANASQDDSNFARSLAKDKAIVEQILDVVPLKHKFILFREKKIPLSKDEKKILDRNTVFSHGRYLLPQYNYHFPEFSTLHIRGNLFEIGRAYFIKPNSKNDSNDIYNISYASLTNIDLSVEHLKIIKKHINDNIIKFNYDKNLYDYHVLDLYYWEIRMGKWMSEVLNETDFSFETLLPFNMRALIDISLSYSLEERKNNFMFNDIINENYPVLNFFGKNEEKNLYEQQRDSTDTFIPKVEKTSEIIKSFIVYDSKDEKMEKIFISDNKVFIPIDYMGPGNYSQVTFKYNQDNGYIKLSLHNKYNNHKGKGYLKYQILVNKKVLLEEDIAMWNVETDLVITGLKKNDCIYIKVISNKISKSTSWQRASQLKIKNYSENYTKNNLPLAIFTNSPHSIIK